MKTIWGESLAKENIHDYYPRPQLMRDSFLSLNGYWDLYMGPKETPHSYPDSILVPFSPECELSGINRSRNPGDLLYYRRFFELPEGFKKDRVILHFGAADLRAQVTLNGTLLGSHRGGYWPFSFDITDALQQGMNELTVCIADKGASEYLDAYGKQSENPGGILYTAQSGLWQTVWLESVPSVYITDLKITPLFDSSELLLCIHTNEPCACRVSLEDVSFTAASGYPLHIPVPDFHAWSPEDPFLYDITVYAGEDCVRSYFGMRKFTVEKDTDGIPRLFLNGKPYFCSGVLDQGYWSDGMYTAPSEEAMVCDIQTMKALGFNTLRKHAKIEPLRWYYLCDVLGMLVWQDMVNGGGPYPFFLTKAPVLLPLHKKDDHYNSFGRATAESRKLYREEVKNTVSLLYNTPSVVLWTAFNEGWGQFDALSAVKRLQKLDPSRLIDHASGWYDQGGGDIDSRHIYFRPLSLSARKEDPRALCLTEFGGYSLRDKQKKNIFSYGKFSSKEALTDAIARLYGKVINAAKKSGLSAAIYTQLSDVEQEENGLLSYDRRTLKIDPEVLQKINKNLSELYGNHIADQTGED